MSVAILSFVAGREGVSIVTASTDQTESLAYVLYLASAFLGAFIFHLIALTRHFLYASMNQTSIRLKDGYAWFNTAEVDFFKAILCPRH